MSRANASVRPGSGSAADPVPYHTDNSTRKPAQGLSRDMRANSAPAFLALFISRDGTFLKLREFIIDFVESRIYPQPVVIGQFRDVLRQAKLAHGQA